MIRSHLYKNKNVSFTRSAIDTATFNVLRMCSVHGIVTIIVINTFIPMLTLIYAPTHSLQLRHWPSCTYPLVVLHYQKILFTHLPAPHIHVPFHWPTHAFVHPDHWFIQFFRHALHNSLVLYPLMLSFPPETIVEFLFYTTIPPP